MLWLHLYGDAEVHLIGMDWSCKIQSSLLLHEGKFVYSTVTTTPLAHIKSAANETVQLTVPRVL